MSRASPSTSTQVAFIAPKIRSAGTVRVYVDGKLVARVSLRSATTLLAQIVTRSSFTYGTHTIRVVNAQRGRTATLDAFVILT